MSGSGSLFLLRSSLTSNTVSWQVGMQSQFIDSISSLSDMPGVPVGGLYDLNFARKIKNANSNRSISVVTIYV